MTTSHDRTARSAISTESIVYRVRVCGQVSENLYGLLNGMTITRDRDGGSTLEGPIDDQATLYELLNQLREIGLVLVSVRRIEQDHRQDTTSPLPAQPIAEPPGEAR